MAGKAKFDQETAFKSIIGADRELKVGSREVKVKIKLSHIRTLPDKTLSAFAHLFLYGLQLQVSKDG